MSDGTTTWNYTYNADGMRTQRTNGTATYKYVYNGSSLVQMTVGSDTLYFTDATVTYNNTVYYYVKNIQGDIVAILDTDGDPVVQYTYDAWGNILTTTGELANTLGQINPLRYRGYVYDTESGLYYLQSRYYDPEIGRFLNADALVSTGQGILGNNMFSYCLNNPINLLDAHGSASIWYYLLKYAYMGYIHSCVEAHIIKHYINVETEVWIRRDGQLVGRADLMQENSVWEIKHGGHDLLTALSRILSATEQAGSYLGGTAVRTGKDVTDLGDALRFKGTFTINAFAVTYQVTYITPSKGTVLYFVNAVDYNCEADYDFNVAIANRLPKPNFANPLNYAPNPVAIGANIMIAVCVFSAFYSVSKQGA